MTPTEKGERQKRVNETGYGSDSMQNGGIVPIRYCCGNRSRQIIKSSKALAGEILFQN